VEPKEVLVLAAMVSLLTMAVMLLTSVVGALLLP
jgi:hypothetical protein